MGLLPALSGGIATPLCVHTGQYGAGDGATNLTSPSATINRVYYQPITIPFDYNVRRVAWLNGNATTTRNIAIGVYSSDGVKLYDTGTVGFTGPAINIAHYATLSTPWLLAAGTYYLAMQQSTTSTRFTWIDPSGNVDQAVLLEDPGSFGLPATMVNAVAGSERPMIGLCRT